MTSRYPYTRQTNGATSIVTRRKSDGVITTASDGLRLMSYESGTLSGYVGKRVIANPPVQHSLTVERQSKLYPLCQVVRDGPLATVTTTGPFGYVSGGLFPPSVTLTHQDAAARNKLLNKIKAQSVNLAQAFGERKQTVNLFATTARRIATAAFAFRKGNWVEACRHLGYEPTRGQKRRLANSAILFHNDQRQLLANSILEVQYGWRPLLNDVYGAAEAIAQANLRREIFESASVRVKTPTVKKSSQWSVGGSKSGVTATVTGSGWIEYKVWWEVYSSVLQQLSSIGLTNPATLIWEFLPWSFIADWFLPIGNWVSTWDATAGLVFRTGYKATSERRDYWYSSDFGFGSETNSSYTRTPLTAFPGPALPQFKNPLGVEHVANALSLLQTAFFRK